MSKKILRNRWRDAAFLEERKNLLSLLGKHEQVMENEDMAGIVLTIASCPIDALMKATLYKTRMTNCNLQFSVIGSALGGAVIETTDFTEAKFDRSAFMDTHFTECNFAKAKIMADFSDAVFERCNFTKTYFSGGSGWAGHGGLRVKFIECDFTDTIFRSLPLRAARFNNCIFGRTQFIATDLRGGRAENCAGTETISYERMDDIGPENHLKII